jgi:hypothetical protein
MLNDVSFSASGEAHLTAAEDAAAILVNCHPSCRADSTAEGPSASRGQGLIGTGKPARGNKGLETHHPRQSGIPDWTSDPISCEPGVALSTSTTAIRQNRTIRMKPLKPPAAAISAAKRLELGQPTARLSQ